jgi:hypothetical protein
MFICILEANSCAIKFVLKESQLFFHQWGSGGSKYFFGLSHLLNQWCSAFNKQIPVAFIYKDIEAAI